MTKYLLIGEVLKPQGIHGEAKVKSYASEIELYAGWKTLYIQKGEEYIPVQVKFGRIQDHFVFLTMEGCTTPEDVEKLRGVQLYIDRDHAAPLEEGDFYICDLIGCRAVDGDGNELGTLTDVLQYGPVDTYVFKTGKGTLMAPALKHVFTAVDVENGLITVDAEKLSEVAVLDH